MLKQRPHKNAKSEEIEAWLFKNKRASTLIQQGLEDAKRGRLVKDKEDYSKYVEKKDGRQVRKSGGRGSRSG